MQLLRRWKKRLTAACNRCEKNTVQSIATTAATNLSGVVWCNMFPRTCLAMTEFTILVVMGQVAQKMSEYNSYIESKKCMMAQEKKK